MWKKLKDFYSLLEKPFHPLVNVLFRILFILWVVVFMICSILFPTRDCSGNSADILTAYAEDFGLVNYNYSPITGYFSVDGTSAWTDNAFVLQNVNAPLLYGDYNLQYEGSNDYAVLHLAPFILYPQAVPDDSYNVLLNVDFADPLCSNGFRVEFVVEYYDEEVGDTPVIEFKNDYTSVGASLVVNLMQELIDNMGWGSLDAVFISSLRVFVSSPSSINNGVPSGVFLQTQFDNVSTGISYAGYLYELGDYISTATADITIVPIINQIVDMVNNFLSIEIFPSFSFYTLLLMAVIIPFVVVILKLWFGG